MRDRFLVSVWRRLALDRNPMRRRGDRIATWFGAFAVFALMVAGVFAGAWCANARRLAGTEYAVPVPDYRANAVAAAGAHGRMAIDYGEPSVPTAVGGDRRIEEQADAAVLGATTGVGVVFAGCGLLWIGNRLRERRRFKEWDAQWAQIAPRWMRQY